jgi:putative intracellular protease/amidase
MAGQRLQGKSVAILATDGFEQVELTKPAEALREAGADVQVVAPHGGRIQGWNHFDKGAAHSRPSPVPKYRLPNDRRPRELPRMTTTETTEPVVHIGVFAAQDGWLLTHPAVEGRFEHRDDALAAARRLAHLESWRGHAVDMLVQEHRDAELTVVDPRM